MFDMLGMMGNFESRKIDRHESKGCKVSTVSVPDSDWEYETAVGHLSYHDGKWIIVEGYDDESKAQKGHNKWVAKMTSDELPETIKDVSTAEICKFAQDLGMETEIEYQKQ